MQKLRFDDHSLGVLPNRRQVARERRQHTKLIHNNGPTGCAFYVVVNEPCAKSGLFLSWNVQSDETRQSRRLPAIGNPTLLAAREPALEQSREDDYPWQAACEDANHASQYRHVCG